MGNMFGLLRNSDRTPDGPYGSLADGYWAKSTVVFYIPPDVSTNRAVLIERGIRKWEKTLADPRVGMTLQFHRDPTAPRDVAIVLSGAKPKDFSGKERWASTRMEGVTPATPWDYTSGTVTIWSQLNNGDLEKTAAHEAGHVFGLTRHSDGGLMDPEIKSGDIHRTDSDMLIQAYVRTDRPRQIRMRP